MADTYFPLHVHSYYSLLDGLSSPKDIAERCKEIDVPGCAITDHGNISAHIQFLLEMREAGKKPILGCEFYVSNKDASIKDQNNRKLAHMCILAKNDAGWKDMVKMVSMSNTPELFYYKPRLDLDRIAQFAQKGNLIAFSGHIGSHMANILFDEGESLKENWLDEGSKLALELQDIFGRGNFFLEVQLMDYMNFSLQKDIAECIREISRNTSIPCVATQDAHYAKKEDADDQRILLCTNMHVTIEQANMPGFELGGFFKSRQYHIPTYEEMKEWHTEEELQNTLKIAEMVEEYNDILRSPVLPKFECPDGMNADEYLRHLCREGWKEKIEGKIDKSKHSIYADRVKHELKVLQGAGLSAYFLVVKDIIDFVRNNGWLTPTGRGSAAGCLVSYLLGITSIDPIQYGLIFERFYNAGRNTKDHISMPDIDIDVPKYARDKIIKYVSEKYGEDHVGQMITFQTMKGRGALKDVIRAYGDLSHDEVNEITKNIIEEHKITDELETMKKQRGFSSIILWCLENTPNKLKKWCFIDDDGNLAGPLAKRFEQAIRLEGTKTAQSKHPAGIVIAPYPLDTMFPMVYDSKSKKTIAGFEMEDLEKAGGLKFDILGIALLDKIMGVAQDLEYGEIHEIC